MFLWEPKMCRHALRLLGMLCNSQACLATSSTDLGMLCKVLGMLATSLADLSMLLQGPRSPTSKRNPPTCCLISCEVKGVVYHQASISMPRSAKDLAKHAEVGRGRCQACLGVAKQAYTSQVPTIYISYHIISYHILYNKSWVQKLWLC